VLKFLKIVMYTVLSIVVLIVGGAIAAFVLLGDSGKLNAESKAYADDAVVAISTKWNREELLRRAAPALRESLKPDDLDNLFAALNTLGPLVEYQGAQGQAHAQATIRTGKQVSAKYLASARFERGIAQIELSLIKPEADWMIVGFHVHSPALIENLVGRKS